ncbi:hypothetical protein IKE82_02250 [Candidatus Saccharibacteria bacterium]|nr:hypothetical protein [Candidatus Saccharibacteria bacterium]
MNYFRYAKNLVPEEVKVTPKKDWKLKMSHFTITKDYWAFRNCKDSDDDNGPTVGVMDDSGRIFMVDDRVILRADGDGYIARSIIEEGEGTIMKFHINGRVYAVVQMDNGERGDVLLERIWKKISNED